MSKLYNVIKNYSLIAICTLDEVHERFGDSKLLTQRIANVEPGTPISCYYPSDTYHYQRGSLNLHASKIRVYRWMPFGPKGWGVFSTPNSLNKPDPIA